MAAVPDASVAVKWFLEEPGSAAARAWRERPGIELHVPDLWHLELANAFCKRARRGDPALDAAELAALMDALAAAPVIVHPAHALARRALVIALDAGVSVYDASYAAVAERAQATFVTADATLYRRLREADPAFTLELLA